MENDKAIMKDTKVPMNFDDFVRLVEAKGFVPVHQEVFFDRIPRDLHVWADYKKGFLLVAKSYFEHLHGANLYGQCSFDEWEVPQVNGLFRNIDWNHGAFCLDVRNELFRQINEVEKKVKILPIWKKFNEDVDLRGAEDFDHLEEVTMDKVLKMPVEVIRMVGL